MVNIVVASQNPAKILAVRKAFDQFKSDQINLISLDSESYIKKSNIKEKAYWSNIYFFSAKSNVSSRPTDNDVEKGAINRLKNLRLACDEIGIPYDYLIAIEGGYAKFLDKFYVFTYVGVSDKNGKVNSGMGSFLQITESMFEYVKAGNSLNKLYEKISGTEGNKMINGITGILTKGKNKRAEEDASVVYNAMIPFFNQDIYQMMDDAIKKESQMNQAKEKKLELD